MGHEFVRHVRILRSRQSSGIGVRNKQVMSVSQGVSLWGIDKSGSSHALLSQEWVFAKHRLGPSPCLYSSEIDHYPILLRRQVDDGLGYAPELTFTNSRARLRTEQCHGRQGLHSRPPLVREGSGMTHHLLFYPRPSFFHAKVHYLGTTLRASKLNLTPPQGEICPHI